jgi:uncharacterized iron-regulated protein
VDEDTVVQALRGADVALLGEKHDNPEHHQLQARMISALATHSVAFEMLNADDAFDAATTAEELAQAVAWDDSGWPEFDLYRPVFDAVFASGARPLAAHPTNEQVRTVMSEGIEAIGEAGNDLAVDRAPTGGPLQSLQQEIVDAHCGYADEHLTSMMVSAQVFKDAWMARSLAGLQPGSVLVAGNGHTRPDRGVPSYLDANTVVVSFREVQHGEENPAAYVDGGADFIWFTSRLDNEDPCEAFRTQLEGMQGRETPTE